MTKLIDDNCCDCDTAGYHCLGSYCEHRYTTHHYCDCCGEEFEQEDLIDCDGETYCEECMKELYDE